MKKLLVHLTIAATAFTMVLEATARPMGGGRSVGRQSSAVTRNATPPAAVPAPVRQPGQQQAQPQANRGVPAAQPRSASPLKGILGGALLGLGLGALLMHFGLGAAAANLIGSILMIALLALAVMFIWRMFKRKTTATDPGFAGAHSLPLPAAGAPDFSPGLHKPVAFQAPQPAANPVSGAAYSQPAPDAPWGLPPDFDTADFLRHAKTSFIRMQAAWDKGDVADLREFTTPEVFAELRMQIQERAASADFTDVVQIDANLLGIENTGADHLASVRFDGMIKPAPGTPAGPFKEVWNLSKPHDGSTGWVLAGIEQIT